MLKTFICKLKDIKNVFLYFYLKHY